MKHLITFSAAAILGAAGLAASILTPDRIDVTDGPGLRVFPITAGHHDDAIEGRLWYPFASDGAGRMIAENGVFYGVEASLDATFVLPDGVESAPLVVLSHGLGGHHRSMSWLASELAKDGAIVLALNHPNSSWGSFDMRTGLNHWTRAQDIRAALDMALSDPLLGDVIDQDRIMVAGFSYGGWTALSIAGVRGNLQGYADHCASAQQASSHCDDIMGAGIVLSDLDAQMWDASYADGRVTHAIAVDPGLIWGLEAADIDAGETSIRLIALGEGDDRLLATDFDKSGFADLLPDAETNHFAPASHFMFLPLCKPDGPAILAAEKDDPVCTDPAGANRAQLHADVIDLIAGDLGL